MPTLVSLTACALLASAAPIEAKTSEGVHPVLHEALSKAGFSLLNKNQKGQAKYVHPKTGDKVHTNLDGAWHMRPATSYTSKRGVGVASLKSVLKKRKYSVDAARTANYHGEKIPVSKVGFVDKQGNAHLPLNTPGRARNALARINQTDNVPSGKKAALLKKVRRMAKQKSVNVSEDITPKQKSWTK